MRYRSGMDIGSTTVKLVIIDESNRIMFSAYERHFAELASAVSRLLQDAGEMLGFQSELSIAVTGSGGMGIASHWDVPFIQEVIAGTRAADIFIPGIDVSIELGGEDSKVTFWEGMEQRMNGTCAGGTGAFIDQMAALLNTDAAGLNELAGKAQMIYSIASRCGVFAKTDIQPLLNQGAGRADIAASILQAVVNQTISALSAGRRIKGKVAFLGGPLFYLDELRKRFKETLELSEENTIFPEHSRLFAALGAALIESKDRRGVKIAALLSKLEKKPLAEKKRNLPPLFENRDKYREFVKRHKQNNVKTKPLSRYQGALFLGIDAGSTTTKIVLTDGHGSILYKDYGGNNGDPLENVKKKLRELYDRMPGGTYIAASAVTGYGEQLVKEAMRIDYGIVETIAHYKAAEQFYPGVDFILDIGGQDMKAIWIQNGFVSSIRLNEACSSGCGSFIEAFARSLNFEHTADFARKGLFAKSPSDLGSKCTVFMNSKVKQAQKEGAGIDDIAAGLAYSVVKNSLYKVIRMRHSGELGRQIICQGGTFYNDAILRAFEILCGKEVIRPAIAGLMGAYGAALYAKTNYSGGVSAMLNAAELEEFSVTREFSRCPICENHCTRTVSVFSGERKFVSGNRCERGAGGLAGKKTGLINMADYKYKRVFMYQPLREDEASRGVIGLPRALNIYENYPLWHTVLTDLGFRVVLSPRSDKSLYEKGTYSIPGDTICYPAKLAHGHVQALIDKGIKLIFFPSVIFERDEFADSQNHYNCAVIQGYPTLLRNNIDTLRDGIVDYRYPVVDLSDRESVITEIKNSFADFGVTEEDARRAVTHGFHVQEEFNADIRKKGEEAINRIKDQDGCGIVLAGRPYHVDPEISHGIAGIIEQEGFHVLTEDAVAHLGEVSGLRTNNEWVYQSRLFAAAGFVSKTPFLEFVELNSFGCGPDSIGTDQAEEILRSAGKTATILKIDEIANLGAARIRIRSLKASLQERKKRSFSPDHKSEKFPPAIFTGDMKKTHTILIPAMTPIREEGLLDAALEGGGYRAEYLTFNLESADVGLRYVNNDFCHALIDYVGQIILALRSGSYDTDRVSVLMMESCSLSCRGSGYISVLRKALNDAGFPKVSVVSYRMWFKDIPPDEDENVGLHLTMPLLTRILLANSYGELFERVICRTRPYEKKKGEIDALHQSWIKRLRPSILDCSLVQFGRNVKEIVRCFDEIPLNEDRLKPRIGLVGDAEVPFDYTLKGVNNICRLLEAEGAEVVIGNFGYLGTSNFLELGDGDRAAEYRTKCDDVVHEALTKSKRFIGLCSILDMKKDARVLAPFAYYKNNFLFGAGGRMIGLLKYGINDIVNFGAFNCTMNYVTGTGYRKEIKRLYPAANIVDIDFAQGIPAVNQINRIRLMMSRMKAQ